MAIWPCERSSSSTRPISLMIEGWMPSVGSSSISSFGLDDQRAADRQLLLLAAGEVAAPAAQHGLEDREQLEDLVGDPALARAAGRRSRSAGSPRRSAAGRSRGPAARSAMPRRARSTVGQAGDVLAVPHDPAGRGPAPGRRRRASVLVLPTPLRPSRQVISPTTRVQRDAATAPGWRRSGDRCPRPAAWLSAPDRLR